MLVELEDVAQHYRRPSIIDIKVRSCISSGYMTGSKLHKVSIDVCLSWAGRKVSFSSGQPWKAPENVFGGRGVFKDLSVAQ